MPKGAHPPLPIIVAMGIYLAMRRTATRGEIRPVRRSEHAFFSTHPPYLPHTNVLPTSYLGRFMFGFGLKAKPEDAVELVLSWYGEGMGESPCWYRNPPFHTAHGASRCDT